ncbi:DUF3631 domain-containing protein [Streptomyces sp. NPDC041003]|uniref:DUF3631 domain-containing protein n=1 Tax=Streptomyces sp. NPDC041003 TaxID=3155730 RepID=UPI0033F47FD9
MTTFPNFLDTVTTTLLGTKPLKENPRHRALLDAYTEVQNLEQRLLTAITTPPEPGTGVSGLMEACTDLLIERLDAGYELSRLLSADYCCAADVSEDDLCGLEQDEKCCQAPAEPTADLLDACSNVFAELGDPHAVASADLVDALRRLPGVAGNHWRYSDLTQARLAELLAPYGMQTRDITLPDGRRRKSYRREALLVALGVSDCC